MATDLSIFQIVSLGVLYVVCGGFTLLALAAIFSSDADTPGEAVLRFVQYIGFIAVIGLWGYCAAII